MEIEQVTAYQLSQLLDRIVGVVDVEGAHIHGPCMGRWQVLCVGIPPEPGATSLDVYEQSSLTAQAGRYVK